ncbi:hypothetical protein DBR06_SOUSAS110429, partial [Sousa chinensis]
CHHSQSLQSPEISP